MEQRAGFIGGCIAGFAILGWAIWRYFFDEGPPFTAHDWHVLTDIYFVLAVLVFAAGSVVSTIRWIRTGKW